MRWPIHPVESVRPSRFLPPFCPWPECTAHRARGRGFQRFGFYQRRCDPRRVPRFRCLDCRRTCSRQTFSTTYYLKRPELLTAVACGLAACSAQRQIARSTHCSKTSVTRMAERLGRHAILFHARCLRSLRWIGEPVVHDHFETFVARQDHALGVGTAVGDRSWFVYDVDPAPHRGSGRRPDRKPLRQIQNPERTPYVASIRRTLGALLPLLAEAETLTLVVDGHAAYPMATKLPEFASRVKLRVFPNPVRGPKGTPRAPEASARDRAMFPVDQLHQLLRHSCADHKRETIAFGRRLESILGRAHLIAVWKNFLKHRSERKPDRTTPAMRLGLAEAPWRWERVLSRRLFRQREIPTGPGLRLYLKEWTSGLPALGLRHAG